MKVILGLLVTVFTLTLLVVVGYFALENWGREPRLQPNDVEFVLEKGEPLASFAEKLKREAVVENEHIASLWIKFFSEYSQFQAGRYKLEAPFSLQSLSMKLRRGDVYEPEILRFTIPEGFTLAQAAKRLAARLDVPESEVLAIASDVEFVQSLGVAASSLEGYLYPATYSFTVLPGPREAFTKMVERFWQALPDDFEQRVEEKGLTLHQAVTFASLIELETHHDSERPLVSEVIWNRLNRNIALAIDASIIYGIKDYAGDLKRVHLNDATNVYNTRVHRGLPPGPIGSPSRKSLLAVLEPASEGNYYYVVDYKTGKHNFSKSLAQHNKYVAKLLRDRRESRQ